MLSTVERNLRIPTTRRIVSKDEQAAYLNRVQEARERLQAHHDSVKGTGHEFAICGTLD